MTLPKVLALLSVLLFGAIGIAALLKEQRKQTDPYVSQGGTPLEVELEAELRLAAPRTAIYSDAPHQLGVKGELLSSQDAALPADIDRIEEFFRVGEPKFPIVETVVYRSRVPWLKGQLAWITHYASHYQTSRHFIARSYNRGPNYEKQDVPEGGRFNVLRRDIELEFYLLVDLARNKMWFYYLDLGTNRRVLVKSYKIGSGRIDPSSVSGSLTPIGKYRLGSRIAIYDAKSSGLHNDQKVAMATIFGTRWIPFEEEVGSCSAPAKGFGIHGVPCLSDGRGGLTEDASSIGRYDSDGCIHLATRDMEELFSIIITKPTTIEIVRDYSEAELPGIES